MTLFDTSPGARRRLTFEDVPRLNTVAALRLVGRKAGAVDQERWVTIWAHVLRPETALRTIGAAADDDLDYLVPAQRIGLVVRPAAATQRLTSPNGPAYLREYVPSLAQYENRNVRTATGEYIATRTEPYVGAVAAQNYIVIVATHMGNPTSGSLTAPTAGTTAATF